MSEQHAMSKQTVDMTLSCEQADMLRGILEQGLPINSRPYLAIAVQINATEQQVIQQIADWQTEGLIRRFGLVVKHRQLGYQANAMVVWDVTDADVDDIATQLSKRDEISLCYRRPRQLPDWPYNLFCMIHGKSTAQVELQIAQLTEQLALQHLSKAVLFSHKAYKQQGARYQRSQPHLQHPVQSNPPATRSVSS
jgi:DNA-binding Lrp family transcriptional regulator